MAARVLGPQPTADQIASWTSFVEAANSVKLPKKGQWPASCPVPIWAAAFTLAIKTIHNCYHNLRANEHLKPKAWAEWCALNISCTALLASFTKRGHATATEESLAEFIARLAQTDVFSAHELEIIARYKPQACARLRLESVVQAVQQTPLLRAMLKAIADMEKLVDFHDSRLHFSAAKVFVKGKDGVTRLQPCSFPAGVADDFLLGFDTDHHGLSGQKPLIWFAIARAMGCQHLLCNDSLSVSSAGFSLFVAGPSYPVHEMLEPKPPTIGPVYSSTTTMPARMFSERTERPLAAFGFFLLYFRTVVTPLWLSVTKD